MPFQFDPDLIRWRLHLHSPPDAVYRALSTERGTGQLLG
jgi:hypothetical protein